MRYLRLTTTPDADAAPAFFTLLAASPHVTEARLVDWNLAADDGATALFSVDGDPDAFADAVPDVPMLLDVDVAPTGADHFYLLVVGDPSAADLAAGVYETVTTAGLVVLKPVVYREGRVHLRMIGSSDVIQAAVEAHPDAIDLEVRELSSTFSTPDAPDAALSERQREAVRIALSLGYYEQPSRATHEDVAEALDCAPSTASEHLKKAEAKLVRAAMDGLRIN